MRHALRVRLEHARTAERRAAIREGLAIVAGALFIAGAFVLGCII